MVSNLDPDGSASSVTTTAVSANGLTRTVTNLVDGIAADSTTSVDATVVAGTTRTETVTNSAGTTVTSKATTVTLTDGNSVTRTTSSDLTDGTTLDLTSIAQTVTNASGSTTTQTDSSANGTLLDETVTTNTPQSNGGLVTAVTTSELDGLGHFIDVGSQTTTISNAGATATTTVVNDSANGTLLSESITNSTVGSADRSVTIYGNGDGEVTQSQTVAVSGGATTDITENSERQRYADQRNRHHNEQWRAVENDVSRLDRSGDCVRTGLRPHHNGQYGRQRQRIVDGDRDPIWGFDQRRNQRDRDDRQRERADDNCR